MKKTQGNRKNPVMLNNFKLSNLKSCQSANCINAPIKKTYQVDVLMIVKNEEEGIKTTLESLVNFKGRILIYDTGSSDDTIAIAQKLNSNVIVGHGNFVNFSQARNDAQTWALSQGAQWVLWLDANDTIKGSVPEIDGKIDGWTVQQEWNCGGENPTKFYNRRLFKLGEGVQWFSPVHEWVKFPDSYVTDKLDPEILTIAQDRTKNSQSSVARWKRDAEMLLAHAKENPTDSRTLFYLGRAYKDIHNYEEAKYWLNKRLELLDFPEERYWAKLFLAEIENIQSNWEKALDLYMEAYLIYNRAEALVAAGKICNRRQKFDRAFEFLSIACLLEYPHHAVLFISANDYNYERWHELGICSYYTNHKNIGRVACQKAIDAKNLDIDHSNLKFYPPN